MWNKYWIDFKKDTCENRVLKVLQYYEWKEVNVWKLMWNSKVCHYCEAIRLLRNKWYDIVNRTQYKGKVQHSFYKLVK